LSLTVWPTRVARCCRSGRSRR